jgi:hypothetical protein
MVLNEKSASHSTQLTLADTQRRPNVDECLFRSIFLVLQYRIYRVERPTYTMFPIKQSSSKICGVIIDMLKQIGD